MSWRQNVTNWKGCQIELKNRSLSIYVRSLVFGLVMKVLALILQALKPSFKELKSLTQRNAKNWHNCQI